MRARIHVVFVLTLLQTALLVSSASPQTRPAPSPQARAAAAPSRDRFEASFGGLWIGGAALGSTQAELRANNVTPTPFRLFATETDAGSTPGFDVRAGYWIMPSLLVEASFVRATPELRTAISADAEGAAALTVAESLDQYFISGNVLWLFENFRFGGTVPFVSGGLGYLRQLHEGQTLVETGQVYQIGGGVRRPLLTDLGWVRSLGLRVQGSVYVLRDGVQLEDQARTHGAISGAVYVTF
jgi:hypothetical protein